MQKRFTAAAAPEPVLAFDHGIRTPAWFIGSATAGSAFATSRTATV
jgi:hypothetical protein